MRSDHLNKHVCHLFSSSRTPANGFVLFLEKQVKTHAMTLTDDHRMKTTDSDAEEINRDHHHHPHPHHQHHTLPHQALLHMHHQLFMVSDIKAEPRMSD